MADRHPSWSCGCCGNFGGEGLGGIETAVIRDNDKARGSGVPHILVPEYEDDTLRFAYLDIFDIVIPRNTR